MYLVIILISVTQLPLIKVSIKFFPKQLPTLCYRFVGFAGMSLGVVVRDIHAEVEITDHIAKSLNLCFGSNSSLSLLWKPALGMVIT